VSNKKGYEEESNAVNSASNQKRGQSKLYVYCSIVVGVFICTLFRRTLGVEICLLFFEFCLFLSFELSLNFEILYF